VKVVITASAIADLIAIGRYIQQDNPRRAVSFVSELEHRCGELSTMAKAFPLVPRHEKSGIRRRAYRGYLIFYRIAANTVEVVHVLHGALDYERILFPEE
jgi:toxin ParE1/3/4